MGSRPSPISINLLCALEQVPVSHNPFLSFSTSAMRGGSYLVSEDRPAPCTSAVQRPKRPAKGSGPLGSSPREGVLMPQPQPNSGLKGRQRHPECQTA